MTPDRLDKDGNVVKTGGYTWLLNKMYDDERCLLYRLVQKTGGLDGQFRPLYGCTPVWCQDRELPADAALSHKIIRLYKPRKSPARRPTGALPGRSGRCSIWRKASHWRKHSRTSTR